MLKFKWVGHNLTLCDLYLAHYQVHVTYSRNDIDTINYSTKWLGELQYHDTLADAKNCLETHATEWYYSCIDKG